ncbi:MAG: hypothetical protein DRP92_07730, partial [Candidatus Neomarinimicrobiota bacterium]
KYVVNLDEIESFTPPHHVNTQDKKLIDESLGAKNFALWYGEVEIGGGVDTHSHEMEQAFYILEGEALFEIEGVEYQVKENTVVFIPPNTKHKILNIGEKMLKILIVMAPQPKTLDVWKVEK